MQLTGGGRLVAVVVAAFVAGTACSGNAETATKPPSKPNTTTTQPQPVSAGRDIPTTASDLCAVVDASSAAAEVGMTVSGPKERDARFPGQEADDAPLVDEHGCDWSENPDDDRIGVSATTFENTNFEAVFDSYHKGESSCRLGKFGGYDAFTCSGSFGDIRSSVLVVRFPSGYFHFVIGTTNSGEDLAAAVRSAARHAIDQFPGAVS